MTQYVRYIGPSHRRVISAHDWKGARLTGDTVSWEASNGFAVPLDQFSETQIEKAIKPDANFVITAEDEEFEPVAGPGDMTPREHAQWLENPVDVSDLIEGLAAGSTDLSRVPSVPAAAAPNGGRTTDARAEAIKDTPASSEK